MLDGLRELLAEREVRDAHVVQLQVEFLAALLQLLDDLARHLLAHRQQLVRVVLRDDGLEHLVADGRQHAVVEVLAELLENFGQLRLLGAAQHAQRDVDHLQVLGARGRVDDARARPDLEHVRVLHAGNPEVRALARHLGQDAAEAVEDDGL